MPHAYSTLTGPRSASVRSGQAQPHERLPEVLARHREAPWRAPVPGHTAAAFEQVCRLLRAGESDRLVLDSGCGSGVSSRLLGEQLPGHVVIGIDRSAARLQRCGAHASARRQGNCIWVRAELAAFWRLAGRAGWRLRRHYLLYPNPWPKARHLRRRWHAHPVFPDLLRLGGRLEMRCNWRVYADEFAVAVGLLTGLGVQPERLRIDRPCSPHERKYLASGHALYAVVAELGGAAAVA